MSTPADWLATDQAPEPVPHVCDDPTCADCDVTLRVADAGARAIAEAVGIEWDTLTDQHVKSHYRLIASEVMAAMSAAMLELGVARPTEAPS